MREAINYQKNNHRRTTNGKHSNNTAGGVTMEVKAILKKEIPSSSSHPGSGAGGDVTRQKSTHRKPEWLQKSDEKAESAKPILYLSIDVETDGPVPGIYSMLSLGLAGFTLDNSLVWEREVNFFPLEGASTYHKTMEWWSQPEQKDAWNHLMTNRQNPQAAMIKLSVDIQNLKLQYRVFTIAWPACFDWMFLHWYMHKFVGENPLGRTAKCAGTYAWAMSKTVHPNVSIDALLDSWDDERFQHSHKALDDAKEQGSKFINMLNEMTRNGKDQRLTTVVKKPSISRKLEIKK